MDAKEAIKTLTALAANCAEGDRHICVLDRGWVFIGKLTRADDGVCTLADCYNIRKWKSGGFGGLSAGGKSAGVTLDKCAAIRFREDAMIFAVPVGAGWENE